MQINIGFSIDDNYCQHCGALIASILKNASEQDHYNFFIVHKYISNENKAKFEELKKIKNFEIKYVKIDDKFFKDVPYGKNLRIEAFYRFFLFQLEDVDKILYLDSDIIVRHDIAELYSVDMKNFPIAGAEDIMGKFLIDKYELSPTTTYINSGVLLINIEKTRSINFYDAINNLPSSFSNKNFGDQDIINYIFQDQILPLEIKWNFSYPYNTTYSDNALYHSTARDPYIIHYITGHKPWIAGAIPFKKEEYFKYAILTPWYKDFIELYKIEENCIILDKLNEILRKIK